MYYWKLISSKQVSMKNKYYVCRLIKIHSYTWKWFLSMKYSRFLECFLLVFAKKTYALILKIRRVLIIYTCNTHKIWSARKVNVHIIWAAKNVVLQYLQQLWYYRPLTDLYKKLDTFQLFQQTSWKVTQNTRRFLRSASNGNAN